MELTASSAEMQSEVEKMATTFLDQIGLQSSKSTATSKVMHGKEILTNWFFRFSQRTLSGISGIIM